VRGESDTVAARPQDSTETEEGVDVTIGAEAGQNNMATSFDDGLTAPNRVRFTKFPQNDLRFESYWAERKC